MTKLTAIICLTVCTLFANYTATAQTIFELPKLPYDHNALEPYIDKETMQIHHGKHHQGYVNNLNKAIAGTELEKLSLEELLGRVSKLPEAIRNNAGGHYNHSLFWEILTPKKDTKLSARFEKAITETFTNLDSLKRLMNQKGSAQFGSGWVWLIVNENKKLEVCASPNQDNPLMDIAPVKGKPILGIDVWEHAYYLKYQNKRADYLSAIWNVVNWEEVSKHYEKLVPKGIFDDWQTMKDFHKVMAQTFHPSEEGNLQPIKTRSQEMLKKAEALKTATIPKEFDRREVRKTIDQLIDGSKKLDKLINSKKADDKAISKSLSELHDVFHKIVGLCSPEEHH
ncbi:MAG: superoxide dismutase [Chitinophagales bacterium]|nr:superoxide dismutase [Chitinophagales bacterium]